MNKTETKEEIELRVKLGKEMIEIYRGKFINEKQAQKILRLINGRFRIYQSLVNDRVILSVQESNQFMEQIGCDCQFEYEHKEVLEEELFFIVNTKNIISNY